MFELEILKDVRVSSYNVMENGNYQIVIKSEWVNTEFNVSMFETEPAVSMFSTNMSQYALPFNSLT